MTLGLALGAVIWIGSHLAVLNAKWLARGLQALAKSEVSERHRSPPPETMQDPDEDLPSEMSPEEWEKLAEVAKKMSAHFEAKMEQAQTRAESTFKPLSRRLSQKAKKSVIRVGDGRGFVVNRRHDRLIVTAAHCLPFFPPCHGASYTVERTYQALLAPLGSEPSVWAECLFADPIADLAVLGSPDNQALFEEANAYEALVEDLPALRITDAPEHGHGWMLSLDQKWFGCTVEYMKPVDGDLFITNAAQPIVRGMSGSPVLSNDGAAIGAVCIGSGHGDWINPRLFRDLPVWLLNAQAMTKVSK